MGDLGKPERTRVVTWEDPKISRRLAKKMGGVEFFNAMRRGEIPEPPFGRLLGLDLFGVAEGKFTMTLEPREYHYNPMGCMHGGILATLLDSVMSGAVHTSLEPGLGYLTLEVKISFHRAVFEHTGMIVAEGKIISCGRQVAAAEGKVMDRNGAVYASGTATCLVIDPAVNPGPVPPG